MKSLQGTWAIVTGASSGIGKEFAIALAEKGVNIVLVARREEQLQRLAAELRALHPVQVRVEAMDLSLPGAAHALMDRLDQAGIPIEILINNAAFGLIGEFIDQAPADLTRMLSLNVVALTDLTHIFAVPMKARRSGYILFVGSVGAFQPCPLYASYAASKAYVLSLGEALHVELVPHNVVVTVLSPGVTETEFFDAAGVQPTASMKRMMMKARPVVDAGLNAMLQGRSGVVAGTVNKLLTFSARILSRHTAAKIAYGVATK